MPPKCLHGTTQSNNVSLSGMVWLHVSMFPIQYNKLQLKYLSILLSDEICISNEFCVAINTGILQWQSSLNQIYSGIYTYVKLWLFLSNVNFCSVMYLLQIINKFSIYLKWTGVLFTTENVPKHFLNINISLSLCEKKHYYYVLHNTEFLLY